ncbi:MAG: mucoidy inhibitor MuiA family protein [Hyphomicrobiaceae bacterium]
MRLDVRWLAPALVVFAMAATPLAAAEIAGTSTISAVTVFSRGAEVTRTAQLKIAQGEHVLVFKDLPAQAIEGSIRIEGRSTGRLDIGSVDTRRVEIPRLGPAASHSERRKLEEAIEKLQDERALIAAEVEAAEAQKRFIEGLVALPTQPGARPGEKGEKTEEWRDIFLLIGSRLAEAEKARLAASLRVREFDRRITDLERELSDLAPIEDARTEVRVKVTAAAALEANLLLRYQVPSASWQSLYDARLMTGARNVAPSLVLIRRAAVQQRTGEDWRDVVLTLSTARPANGASAPSLDPTIIDFVPDAPAPRPMASPAPTTAPPAGRARRPGADGSSAPSAAAAAEREKDAEAEIGEQQASAEISAFQARFDIPGRTTVLAGSDVKRVLIDEAKIEPTLVVRTVPRLRTQAYLYAKVAAPKTTAYLPGAIALFRDGTYVGHGKLPLLAPGQEHEIGFGTDDSVRVRYATVEDRRGETGLISSQQTDTRAYRILVKNLHERAIAVSVLDSIPTSRQQDIKVELIGKTPPTRRDVDDKRGVLAWEALLQPDEERQIDFGYRVSWPAGKRVIYGR